MNILDKRQESSEDILRGRFIRKVFAEAAREIDADQRKYMTAHGFRGSHWQQRTFNVTDNQLDYEHLKVHRFVDMRTRTTDGGAKKKKSHPIHNRIIFGHYNNIIRELKFGYTDEVKNMLLGLEE